MKPTPRTPLDPNAVLVNLILTLYRRRHPLKDTPTTRINAVIAATNLTNSLGESPTHEKTTPINGGYAVSYTLPAGIIPKDFHDRQAHFETYGSFLSEIHNNGTPTITIHTYKEELPTMLKFTYEYSQSHGLAPIPLGQTPSGAPLTTDLSKMPHMLIGGMTGYGKTSLLLAITVALRAAGCNVIVVDHKRADFNDLDDYLTITRREPETLAALNALIVEMNRRMDLFLTIPGCQKFQQYTGGDLPYIVLIVDELNTLNSKPVHDAINELVRVGRAAGISLILATQKPSAKVWENFTDTRDLCTGRLSFYVSDTFMSTAILGKFNTRACSLPSTPGRAVVVLGDKENIVQTMYLTNTDAQTELAKYGKVAKQHELNTIWTPTPTEHINPTPNLSSNDHPPVNDDPISRVKRRTKGATSVKANVQTKTTKAHPKGDRS